MTDDEPIDLRRFKLEQIRVDIERYRAEHEARRPMLNMQARLADAAVRSSLLLNGGAALALLNLKMSPGAVVVFGLGAAFGAGAASMGFVASLVLAEHSEHPVLGNLLRWSAIACGAASLAAFVVGIILASQAISP